MIHSQDGRRYSKVQVIKLAPPHEARPRSNDAFEWKRDPDTGIVDVLWRGGETLRGVDADNVEFEAPFHSGGRRGKVVFCDACCSAVGYLARGLARYLEEGLKKVGEEEEKKKDGGGDGDEDEFRELDTYTLPKVTVVHHWNIMGLIRATKEFNCPLCECIWARSVKEPRMSFEKASSKLLWFSMHGRESWKKNSSNPGDARLAVLLGSQEKASTFNNALRFQLWGSPEFDRFFVDQTLPELSKLSIEDCAGNSDKSNTRSCQPLAIQWLSECRANTDGKHDACNASKSSWKPTRLLDLQALKEDGKVLLVSQTAELLETGPGSDYITLSHCWGKWGAKELSILTTSNIQEREREGMDLSLFPQTFKDAVEIAGWFNVRYLWIDSFCIIQDSCTDWEHEAYQMCEVYKHALLNISADSSVDARGGCFKDRAAAAVEPFKLRLKNLDTTWWATPDERNLFEWVANAPISTRAWVLQERHLSRRVLHFTELEVFWECCAATPSFRSETYPMGSPLKQDFLGQHKFSLPNSSAGRVEDDTSLSNMWDEICQGFSKRLLTNITDTLPALSGLAKEMGTKCKTDTYVAGMWASSFPRTLLWTALHKERKDKPSLDPKYIAPSWSWMSVGTPVEMQKRRYMHQSLINIVSIDCKQQGEDQYRRIKKSSISIKGFLRKLRSVDGESPFERGSRAFSLYSALGIEKSLKLYVDDNFDDTIGHGSGQVHDFHEALDYKPSSDTRDFYCLLMEVNQYSKNLEKLLFGLLLEPTEEQNYYRRIGRIFFRTDCALRMRYRQVKGDPGDWSKVWSKVRPYWEPERSEMMDKGPKDIAITHSGPMSLYDFDVAATDLGTLERLRPETITLI